MELNTLISTAIGWLPTCYQFLQESGIGQEIKDSAKDYLGWFGNIFSKKTGPAATLEEVKKNANDKNKSKLEAYLEIALEEQPELKTELEVLLNRLEQKAKKDSGAVSIINSKNVVLNSKITVGGDFRVGDNINSKE